MLRTASLSLAVVLVALASSARADVIGLDEPCPPGSTSRQTHMGTWCVVAACPEDGQCEARLGQPHRCRELRVCTEERRVPIWRGAEGLKGDEDAEPIRMVVETCEPSAGCDGTGDRAPTVGELVEGTRSCETMRVCAPVPWPSLRDRRTEPPPQEEPAPPAPRSAPPGKARGCGCGAARASTSSAWPLALALLAWRRR